MRAKLFFLRSYSGTDAADGVETELVERFAALEARAERAERERDEALARLEKWRTAVRQSWHVYPCELGKEGPVCACPDGPQRWTKVPEGEE